MIGMLISKVSDNFDDFGEWEVAECDPGISSPSREEQLINLLF